MDVRFEINLLKFPRRTVFLLSPGHTVTIFITDHHGSTFRDETWSIPGKVRHDPS